MSLTSEELQTAVFAIFAVINTSNVEPTKMTPYIDIAGIQQAYYSRTKYDASSTWLSNLQEAAKSLDEELDKLHSSSLVRLSDDRYSVLKGKLQSLTMVAPVESISDIYNSFLLEAINVNLFSQVGMLQFMDMLAKGNTSKATCSWTRTLDEVKEETDAEMSINWDINREVREEHKELDKAKLVPMAKSPNMIRSPNMARSPNTASASNSAANQNASMMLEEQVQKAKEELFIANKKKHDQVREDKEYGRARYEAMMENKKQYYWMQAKQDAQNLEEAKLKLEREDQEKRDRVRKRREEAKHCR